MENYSIDEKRKITIKPDVLIEYSINECYNHPTSVIYVRPETNAIAYEKAIISGIKSFGDVVYMANINGKVFIKDALIFEHYASQYKFAIYGKKEIIKHPEMVKKFKRHFKTSFKEANIIGSFDAIQKLKISSEELFNTFVEKKDFIKYYGQTIKRIKNTFIVNYDLPALIKKHDTDSNVFVIVARLKKTDYNLGDINKSILQELKKDKHAPIIDEKKFKSLGLSEIVKRTYHVSHNHLMAMFDMIDFVFKKDGTHHCFYETPLGKKIIDKNKLTQEDLKAIKDYPIIKIIKNDKPILVNIIDEASGKKFDECVDLINGVIL